MATIALVMIVKDEAEILETCLGSVRGIVDEFVVVDTGSTDQTREIIARYGAVHETPFVNFVETKNKALSLATADYVLFMDADERVYQGLAQIKAYAEQGVDCLTCLITEGATGDDASVGNQYLRARMWKNDGRWAFSGPFVHEYIAGPENAHTVIDRSILVRHEHLKSTKAATSAERFSKYTQLLKSYLNEVNPDDARALFYLARTYKDLGQNLAAVSVYKHYLRVPNNTFIDERWQAAHDISLCYFMEGEHDKALEYCGIALSIDNRRAESHTLQGDILFQQQEYQQAIEHYKQALSMPMPEVSLFCDPKAYTSYPREQTALASYRLGLFRDAEEVYRGLLSEAPNDSRLINNIWWCGLQTRMTIFLTLGQTPELIYGGILAEQGVHGVETAYIELADCLAAKGHNVFLFCSTEQAHSYQGVSYIPWQDTAEYLKYQPDVVITSRWFDALYYEDTSKKIIWLQDAHFKDPSHPDAFERAASVVCSSPWHQQYIFQRFGEAVRKEKLHVIPLGIRKELFAGMEEKIDRRVLYASNPDRGLEELAAMWGSLTEAIPGISLEVVYGWEGLLTWDTSPEWQSGVVAKRDAIRGLFGDYGNVTFSGRVTKAVLASKMKSSALMIYPNNFPETFCLTALEAQAAGLPSISTDLGALATTYDKVCNRLIAEDSGSAEYAEAVLRSAQELFNAPSLLDDMSRRNRQSVAMSPCDWRDVADRWEELIWRIK